MPRAKKEGLLSSVKSIVMGLVDGLEEKLLKTVVLGFMGGIEEGLLKKMVKYVVVAVFAVLGVLFLLFGLKDFLAMYMPGYVSETVVGAVLLGLALILKRG